MLQEAIKEYMIEIYGEEIDDAIRGIINSIVSKLDDVELAILYCIIIRLTVKQQERKENKFTDG